MKLRARWCGPAPRVGDYLASPTRLCFAYHIRDVRNVDSCVRWDPVKKAELRSLAIEVDRLPITKLPTTARVHEWRWDKRSSSRDLTR